MAHISQNVAAALHSRLILRGRAAQEDGKQLNSGKIYVCFLLVNKGR